MNYILFSILWQLQTDKKREVMFKGFKGSVFNKNTYFEFILCGNYVTPSSREELQIIVNRNVKHFFLFHWQIPSVVHHLIAVWAQGVLIETWFYQYPHSKLTDLNSEHMNVSRDRPASHEGQCLTCIPYYQEKGLGMCVIAILSEKFTQCICWIMSLR